MKNRKCSMKVCIGFLALVGLSAGAQEIVWEQTNGPYCGEIEKLFVTPQGTLFASTRINNFFRSQDGGNSWTQSSTGLTYRDWSGKDRVPAVLTMSFVGNAIYAGTEQAGIFRSDDDGESWILVNNRLTSGALNDTRIVSSLMVIEDIIIAGTMGGLCRSEDAGATWEQVSEGWGLGELQKVHSLVNMGQALYAAVEFGIFRSEDKGASWHPTGFHSSTVLHAGTDGALYTGTRWDGIFRSKDEGKSWEEVNTGLPKRDQFGAFPHIYSLAEVGKRLYAGTDKGVFRWEDKTKTWIQTGLANFYVYSCAATTNSLYAGTNGGGVFRLDDGNDNWMPANTGLVASSVQSLAAIDGSVYAGTYGGGVFRSQDSGDSWIPFNSGLTDTFVLSLGVIDGFLHAGTRSGDVFRLDGNSWTRTNLSEKIFVKLFIEVGGRLYAVGDNRSSVLRSEDGGETWIPADNGLPQQAFEIHSLESSGTNIYVISNQGVYLSEDGGDTWNDINTGLTNHFVRSLAMAGDTLYAGTWGDGVFRSLPMVVLLGDVNNDGKIRSNDAILALRIAAGLMDPTEYQKHAADINSDGKIRSNDAILILREAAGLVAPSGGYITGKQF